MRDKVLLTRAFAASPVANIVMGNHRVVLGDMKKVYRESLAPMLKNDAATKVTVTDGAASFDEANELFKRFPRRRAVVSGIGAVGSEFEVRSGNQRHVEGRVRASLTPSRHEERFG